MESEEYQKYCRFWIETEPIISITFWTYINTTHCATVNLAKGRLISKRKLAELVSN